jgi:ligand-binding sensor domain-containing protein
MYQDPIGRLWLGTSEGLSIYDGNEFKNYRTTDGLSRDFITSLAGSRESATAVWIGTLGGGVCKLIENTFSYIDLGPKPAANAVNALLEDSHGVLWVGTGAGLFRVFEGRAELLPLETGQHGVSGIVETHQRGLWIGMTRGISLLRDERPTLTIDLELHHDEHMSALHVDGNEDVWVGTSRGNVVLCNEQGIVRRTSISKSKLTDIISDRDGMLWICSEDGLLVLKKELFGQSNPTRFGVESGFVREYFSSVYLDREDNLWVGGLGLGLYKLRDRALLQFPLVPLKPGHAYNPPVAVDAEGRVWAIDGDGLIELWQRSDARRAYKRHGLKDGRPHSQQRGLDSTLWVGLISGDIVVYRARGNEGNLRLVQRLRLGVELPVERWNFFLLDSRGSLWLSIYPIGVVVLDGREFASRTTLRAPDAVPHQDIRVIHEAGNGDIWIGGLGGGIVVYRRTPEGYLAIRRLVSGNGLDDENVRSILVDREGRCWTGTRWGGITLTVGDRWKTLTSADGLLSNAVVSLAEDSSGSIWVGTPLGLQRVDADSFQLTTTVPGLVGESVYHCGVTGSTVWAYTQKSLALYRLDAARARTVPPLISIREFRVNGTSRPISALPELSHDESNITIEFMGISFKNETAVRYRYRLLGTAEEWSTPTPHRVITYAALSPGTYAFEVQAIGGDRAMSDIPAAISFTILPPVWQRWWFQVSVAVLLASVLWALYRMRVAKLLEVERTRLRIARDLHDEIGSTLSSISFFAQAARSAPAGGKGTNTERLLSLIAESSAKAKSAISDIIWAIDPSNDDWDELLARMRRYASDVCESKGIRYRIDLPPHVSGKTPSMNERRNLWLLFKEMVANAAQHSRCSHLDVEMKLTNGAVILTVKDDGTGFEKNRVAGGTGLKSINDRARALGANVELDTGPGKGTSWRAEWRLWV